MARDRWWGNWPVVWGAVMALGGAAALADETEEQKTARIRQMSPEQKAELLGKKERFEDLTEPEKSRLVALHKAVSSEANAPKLEDTIRRYNRWLANLSSGQRAAILKITDPKQRIDKIKELMEQQEKDRFTLFVQEEVTKADRDAIYAWAEDFVARNARKIMHKLPEQSRDRLESLPDDVERRRQLLGTWSWHLRRRDPDMPMPSKSDFDQLVAKLSPEARTRVNALAKAETRDQRLADLMRAAIISRNYTPPTREELIRFYAAMPSDDPRRERLEGLERDELYEELKRIYNAERFGFRYGRGGGTRGGQGSGRGGPGVPGPREGVELRGERPEFKGPPKGFDGKRPPPDNP